MELEGVAPDAADDLFETVHTALVLTQPDGVVVKANEAASELTGRPRAALTGVTIAVVFAAAEGERVQALAAAARRGSPAAGTLQLAGTSTGSPAGTLPGEPVSVAAHRLAGGRVLGWELREVAERDRLLAEVDAALERVRAIYGIQSVFLAAFRHDLKAPVAAILNSADLLAQRATTDEQPVPALWVEALAHIRAGAEEIARVLGDLGDLGRLAQGAFVPHDERVDVVEFVTGLVDARDFGGRSVVTEFETLEVVVDRGLLARAVDNVLANAVRHTPARSTIWVRVQAGAGGPRISVEDDGPGIPPWTLDEVAESGAGETVAGGGLHIVARFFEALGGQLSVAERPGGGSRVTMGLPAAHAPT